MIAAGLLAKKAVERGLAPKPWVKTTLAPGSRVVIEYYDRAGLHTVPGKARLQCGRLRLHHLHRQQRAAAAGRGRHTPRGTSRSRCCPATATSRAASTPSAAQLPGLAAAGGGLRAGRDHDTDLTADPLGTGSDGAAGLPARYLADGGRDRGSADACARRCTSERVRRRFAGDEPGIAAGPGRRHCSAWDDGLDLCPPSRPSSTGCRRSPAAGRDRGGPGARPARRLGHHRPHLPGRGDQRRLPAGRYLIAHGVQPRDFNSYGSRRGNHEVMVRGTFANIRLRNQLAPGTEGGFTVTCRAGSR